MLRCDRLVFSSCDWCISILAVSVCCSFSGPLYYGSPVVVFLDRGHPRFRNFYSTIPVDVVRVKSYVNRLFDPENRVAVLNPRSSISLLRFYPMSKAYLNNFAAAYSNKAYALFSSWRLFSTIQFGQVLKAKNFNGCCTLLVGLGGRTL